MTATRVLVVDNHDSFVHTIVQYLRRLGAHCDVRPRDRVGLTDTAGFDGVLISPGPGSPEAAGISVPLVRHAAEHRLPLLGVCLGHQAIAVAYGATVARAPELMHGRTSPILHDGRGGVPLAPVPGDHDPVPLARGRARDGPPGAGGERGHPGRRDYGGTAPHRADRGRPVPP